MCQPNFSGFRLRNACVLPGQENTPDTDPVKDQAQWIRKEYKIKPISVGANT